MRRQGVVARICFCQVVFLLGAVHAADGGSSMDGLGFVVGVSSS
jgi:hypothetical protein